MTRFCIAASLIIILASPAFAQTGRKIQKQRASQTTSQDVYVGKRRIGRDPDPSVRFEMLRQDNWRKGRLVRFPNFWPWRTQTNGQ